jgi:hypothetical protein
MPSTSDKQRKLMALAEFHPDQVSKKNEGVLKMSKGQLSDFAATKGLKSNKALSVLSNGKRKKGI